MHICVCHAPHPIPQSTFAILPIKNPDILDLMKCMYWTICMVFTGQNDEETTLAVLPCCISTVTNLCGDPAIRLKLRQRSETWKACSTSLVCIENNKQGTNLYKYKRGNTVLGWLKTASILVKVLLLLNWQLFFLKVQCFVCHIKYWTCSSWIPKSWHSQFLILFQNIQCLLSGTLQLSDYRLPGFVQSVITEDYIISLLVTWRT